MSVGNTVHIYDSGMKLLHKLTEHDLTVTGIHWGSKGRIITCGQDRNAFVWAEKGGHWKPTLVLLRINRAATCARWSPDENKFAVGNGARLIAVCYFEKENNWWVSKHIKKPIKSTVLSVAWHPNNIVLAAGSSDFKCRLFSGFIKGVDKKDRATNPFTSHSNFSFGECLGEFEASHGWGPGWVHDCDFSPSGNILVFVGHDSTINFVEGKNVQTHRLPTLPFTSVRFVAENKVVAAGHDCAPFMFTHGSSGWDKGKSMDKGANEKGLKIPPANASSNSQTPLPTAHQNSIMCVQSHMNGNKASLVSTSSVDGRICTWKV